MNTRTIIAKAIQVVTFLFSAFSGFLGNIAPPEEAGAGFAVGFASILSLCVLLFVSYLAHIKLTAKRFRNIVLVAAAILIVVGIVSGLMYNANLNALTVGLPPEAPEARHVVGTEFTDFGKAQRDKNPSASLATFIYDNGGAEALNRLWKQDSLNRAKQVLLVNYVILVLSIAGAVFFLAEGLLAAGAGKPRK